MNDANRHLLTLFAEVLEAGSPEAQAAYLDRACGGDPELRARMEALLRAHENAGGFLGGEASARDPVATIEASARSEGSGTVIGPYRLLQQIGEGGMGTVYMAEQTRPVQRKVALKIIKLGMDSRQVSARFEAERQVLALMDHPNIAKVLDAGTTESGRPYFVMELVKGVPITKYCDERRLTPKQRLELFVPVCQAVQHAHQKGIIHRDLKPSNVLIALYDDKPVPKVIDFGIAKATGQKLTDRTMFTEFGQVVGTLEYMSPEQAGLNQLDIDTRSDIYSLGVLLYELLTGTTPLEKKRLRDGAMLEILRLIREEEPPKPSTRLSATDELPSLAANRGLEPKKLSGLMRGELDWIVMKALEKDRNRRYETANGFAMDLQRYLADEPVEACPPSTWYRLRKFGRRQRAPLGALALIVLALLLGTAVSTWQAIRATAAEGSAKAAEKLANDRLLSERAAHTALDSVRAEKEKQQTRLNREFTAALVEVARLRNQVRTAPTGDMAVWARLRETFRAAETLAGNELADPTLVEQLQTLRGEIEQAEKDRQMAARLDAIRLDADGLGGLFRDPTVNPLAYQRAFEDYGLPFWKLPPDEVARRLASSPIRESLLAALDEYAGRNPQEAARWLSIALRVTDEPLRRRYYEARIRDDWAALAALAKEPDFFSQPPALILGVGKVLGPRFGIPGTADLLRTAQRHYPADPQINSSLAEQLVQLGNHAKSVQERQSYYEESVGYARAALAAVPQSPALHNDLGRCLTSVGHYEDALAVYAESLRLKPDNPWAYSGRARAYEGKGQWDETVANFSKCIDLVPPYADLFYERAFAYRKLGQLNKAVADYSKAIELRKGNTQALFYRAEVYGEMGEWDKAATDYTETSRLLPTHRAAWIGLAHAHQKLGRWDEAVAAYEQALKGSAHSPWLNDYAWLLATCPEQKVRNPTRAVELAQQAMKIPMPDASCWQTLGVAQYRSGDAKSALANLKVSMARRKGGDAVDWFFLAMTHQKLGHQAEAHKAYDQAVHWLEENASVLQKDPPRAEELRRFQAEAEEVLELKK